MADTGGEKHGLEKIHASPGWQESATRGRSLYDSAGDVSVSYPRVTCRFAGLAPQEVRSVVMEAYTCYAKASQKKDSRKKVARKGPWKLSRGQRRPALH